MTLACLSLRLFLTLTYRRPRDFSRRISMHFLENTSWENSLKDEIINPVVIIVVIVITFLWLCIDIVRRKLMFITDLNLEC